MNRLITAAMAATSIFAATSTDVLAGETWLCESESGNMYRSEENARPGFCHQPKDDEPPIGAFGVAPSKIKRERTFKKFCESAKGASCKDDKNDAEEGVLHGVSFRLYEDGSGIVSALLGTDINKYERGSTWDISCNKDKMTSQKSCGINRGDLYIIVKSGGGFFASIGSDHFPGSLTSIKVGARRFDTTHHDGDFANGTQIVSLMKDGVPIVTRYMKWPHRSWVDDEYSIYGLQVAIQAAKWQLAHGNIK